MSLKIASRNVNGIRAVLQKWFYQWVQQNDRDIICLQETKAFEHQLPAEFRYHLQNYHRIWHAWQKPGYAGTVTLYKKNISLISSKSHFGETHHFHEDGRVVETIFDDFILLNVYFPNGWEKSDGTEMLSYKLKFYEYFIEYIDALRHQYHDAKIIVTWDFNICHKPIDIARPKENVRSIWFLPIERAEMDKMEDHGYVDVFRYFYPTLSDQYTWWSYRAWAKANNVWWRLDYFRVSSNVLSHIQSIHHHTAIEWSDHCPISLSLDI